MTSVFVLQHGSWLAMWKGKLARATFNSKGAAQAWIDTCEAKGKFHS